MGSTVLFGSFSCVQLAFQAGVPGGMEVRVHVPLVGELFAEGGMGGGGASEEALSLKNDCWGCTDGGVQSTGFLLLLEQRGKRG